MIAGPKNGDSPEGGLQDAEAATVQLYAVYESVAALSSKRSPFQVNGERLHIQRIGQMDVKWELIGGHTS